IQDIEEFFAARSIAEDKESLPNQFGYFYFLNKVKEEQTFTPFAIDAYQENALKAIKRGNSMVIQGPPGTGKSQLICNLIADFIARGQRVLLVCQKRVALDVVYERLQEKGLENFVALVHDFKNDRKKIYDQLSQQVDNVYEYQVKNNSLDTIQLERQFIQASRRIDQITEELEEFKSALFDQSECGIAVKELYLTSDFTKASVNLRLEYKYFNCEKIEEFLPKLRTYTAYAAKFEREGYPWNNRKKFKNYSISDLKKIREIIREIPEYQEKMSTKAEKYVHNKLSLTNLEAILSKEEKIHELIKHIENEKVYFYFGHMINFQDKETDYLWLGTVERVVLACFKGAGPETTLSTAELGHFQETLQRRIEARKGLLKFIKWKIFSKDKQYIKEVLQKNGLQSNKRDFSTLIEKIDNRLNLEHNLTKLRANKTLIEIPKTYNPDEFSEWFHNQKLAIMAKLIFSSLRNFKEYYNVHKIGYHELIEQLLSLLKIIEEIPAKKNEWTTYLTPKQIHYLLEEPDYVEKMLSSLDSDFDALCDFDNLSDSLESYEVNTINRLLDQTEVYREDYIEQLFQNSVRLSWIEHIESKYPILRSISSLKFERLQQEYQENVQLKMQISQQMSLLKVRERTYNDLNYNRLNNLVTYRDLKHQTTKKKKIWPIRKLVSKFTSEVFDLVPCWMASPEAVSAIFPMEQVFDLVIFDEASQCFVERGIPAMYRGKQIVVTGDDKQLAPYDLYKVRWEEESEDPALEIDSLLDLTRQFLMQVQLQGHYRSKSLDLIDFSNRHFYNGSLKLLPDHEELNKAQPAIDYIKVSGTWQDHVNTEEANKVVELCLSFFDNQAEKTIGIVTFNVKQQGLIIDLLEQKAEQHKIRLPDSLIVKNIENVQGDEKDIIIFSIGYAPDKNGRMVMQFGSLNAVNGENRLNVAVTRAREKIYVISSIMPHELKVEDTKNEGPKLLKAYLNYALEVSNRKFKPSLPRVSNQQSWYLRNKIKNMLKEDLPLEFDLSEELPFTDLVVKSKDEDKYLGLVLTDDDLYHRSISVKESHVYKHLTMSGKKWPYREFYSREYWHDKNQVKERLIRFVKNIL
ncbi:MAG: AAA domain-containing protein, partial [Cyclobacteriaceae bacterium]